MTLKSATVHASNFSPAVAPNQVRATLGLISDTHFGQRLQRLPEAIFQAFQGVDLILHAGDVGELSVLDQLSEIAPVVAVHGNDDSVAAKASLPYQQTIVVGGERVFLWHSHHADPIEERNSRIGDDLRAKLRRTVDTARASGASLAHFGHWHIPLVFRDRELSVVNAGAVASANEVTRQKRQVVALAVLLKRGDWRIAHVDLAEPEHAYDATLDFDGGFQAAMARYTDSILDMEMRQQMPLLKAILSESEIARIRKAIEPAARQVWAGNAPLLSWQSVAESAAESGLLTSDEISRLRSVVQTLLSPPVLGE